MRERTLKQKLEYAVSEKMGKDITVLIRTSFRPVACAFRWIVITDSV